MTRDGNSNQQSNLSTCRGCISASDLHFCRNRLLGVAILLCFHKPQVGVLCLQYPNISYPTSTLVSKYCYFIFVLLDLGYLKDLHQTRIWLLHQPSLGTLWVLALWVNSGEHNMYYLPALSIRCQFRMLWKCCIQQHVREVQLHRSISEHWIKAEFSPCKKKYGSAFFVPFMWLLQSSLLWHWS